MERTLSVNYPVIRQNKRALLNTFEKPQSKDTTLYINTGSKKGLIDRMYRKESNDCGFLRTYSIIRAYFALVQGSSH